MDKIKLLKSRRAEVLAAGASVRETIAELVDADSFVELAGFSFSKNDFYGKEAAGEGVVTGFAALDGYPVYIAAQNFEVMRGGVSAANCAKILKCLELAEKNSTPVLYILNSAGVQLGEGVTVLEGLAGVIAKASKLRGVVPQFAIVNGEVYGQSSLLAAASDFTFFMKNAVVAADSPFVIAAKSGKNLPKEQVGGAEALADTGLVSFVADDMKQVREDIAKILAVLPEYNSVITDNGADLNASFPELNERCDASGLAEAVFDEGTAVECGTGSPELHCLFGRIGGISAAAIVFDGGEPVLLNERNVAKALAFAEFVSYYDLPFVTFVNAAGVRPDLETNGSAVLKNVFRLFERYDMMENAKISVVYKNAVGLGYSLFAAKSAGFDYVYAFADAKIALFDDAKGAEIEFAEEAADKAKLAERYASETADPINAAKNGYVDNIIEPQFIKQYLVASLQMLLK